MEAEGRGPPRLSCRVSEDLTDGDSKSGPFEKKSLLNKMRQEQAKGTAYGKTKCCEGK